MLYNLRLIADAGWLYLPLFKRPFFIAELGFRIAFGDTARFFSPCVPLTLSFSFVLAGEGVHPRNVDFHVYRF